MSQGAVDPKRLAAEWLRALRGRRSQVALSRRLGYRSNISYRWESGRCFPSASATLRLVQLLGGDVRGSLARFYRSAPSWLAQVDVCSVQGIARLLDDLRGGAKLIELARRSGFSRFAVTRWLHGRADPTLPEFLALVEFTSHRVLDFIAAFTDPEQLPSARAAWRSLQAARDAAYGQPWSHAVLRALELQDYLALPRHEPGWLARRLGITDELEQASLELLERSGQIRRQGAHYRPVQLQRVDTRSDPQRALELRAGWAAVGVERLRAGVPGMLSYNLGSVSRADLDRIEQLQRAHYRQIVNIIAESTPSECVVLYAAQLLALSGRGS
jgi:transcriptional regulator with XRE-family HTH domain